MITASEITMRYGKKILFEGVSIKFRPNHRYGLIGANGAGKSTFMKILTGQEEQTSGAVAVDQGCTLGYLRQDHYAYTDERILDVVAMGHEKLWALHVEREDLYSKDDLTDKEGERVGEVEEQFGEAGGYTMESDAAKLLVGLGISEEQHEQPMSILQGGFRLRVLLAQVLFAHPDILLLDEPTNHLDMASIDWLVDFLKQYDGTVVVISHNRYFLNSVSTHTADLDYQEIRLFPGNYDDFMMANQIILEKNRKDTARKEKRISELKGFINRFGANASKAKQATSRQKELDRIQVDKMKPSSRVSPYIRFEAEQRLGDKVIEATEISQAYDKPLFSNFSSSITKDDKIAVIGKNGAGKTTLLRILLKQLKPDHGVVEFGETVQPTYFPQDAGEYLKGDMTAVEWLARFAPDESIAEEDLRAAMGRMLFRGEEALKSISVLSGGEKARLLIARMLLEKGNVLVFDEPTNHLDLESIESLNYALTLVDGPVLLVSHDREFINSLATRIIELEDGQITDYPGTLSEYETWKAKRRKTAKVS